MSSPRASTSSELNTGSSVTTLSATSSATSSTATMTEKIVDGEIDTTDTSARYLALLGMPV
jgi:hypothetical protein